MVHAPARTSTTISLSLYAVLIPLLAGVTALLGAQAASAHAEVVSLYPANASVLTTAPTEVKATFGEDLMPGTGFIRVTGPGGVVTTTAEVSGAVLRSDLPSGLGAGGYQVLWRVTSADGHPVSGTWAFSIKPGGGSQAGIGIRPSSNAAVSGTNPFSPSGSAGAAGTPGATTVASPTATVNSDSESGGVTSTEMLLGIGALIAAAAGVGTVLLKGRRRPDKLGGTDKPDQ